MEDRDVLTLRNRGVRLWLSGVLLSSVLISAAFPPAVWLFGAGMACMVTAVVCHSARTGQHYTWERWEPRLNWFEGWLACTGAVLFVAPLIGLVFAR